MSQRWQPMHTAPRDGRVIDLWHEGGFRIPDCRYAAAGRTKQWIDSKDQVIPSETVAWWIDRMPQQ